MLSIQTAKQLKEAGLQWKLQLHDFFAVPDRGLDDRFFALSDMTVAAEVLNGHKAITFNGAVEWALDFVYQQEVIWVPREDQLRQQVVSRLAGLPEPIVRLETDLTGYICTLQPGQEESVSFRADDASEAYAAALLHILNR